MVLGLHPSLCKYHASGMVAHQYRTSPRTRCPHPRGTALEAQNIRSPGRQPRGIPVSPTHTRTLAACYIDPGVSGFTPYIASARVPCTGSMQTNKGVVVRILVTGSRGLIGSKLVPALKSDGHDVLRLTHTPTAAEGTIVLWNPDSGEILDQHRLGGLDVVIHLAGQNIAASRWTPEQKASIRNSRVQGTALLARTLNRLDNPPSLFICASAIGYYGNCGDQELTEDSPLGEGFMAGVCRDWEAAADMSEGAGIRMVKLRLGFVISPDGGGLKKMLPPFRWGVGGKIASGKQWMSWVDLEDVVGIVRHIMDHPEISGPVNAVSPSPVTNAEFTRTLAKELRRPAFFTVPAFVVRTTLGEMADELLLSSAKVMPTRLTQSGYEFKKPVLAESMRAALAPTDPLANRS